jgi:uncharacterized protein
MEREALLAQVKAAVLEVEPEAEVILYGSRVHGRVHADSDWDFLILVDGPISHQRQTTLARRLYALEWSLGFSETIMPIMYNRDDWQNSMITASSFWRNVTNEGVLV